MTGFTSFYRKVLPIKEIIIMICLFLFCDPFQRILSAESRRKPTRTLPRPTCSNTGKSNDRKLLKQSSKTIISQIETLMTNWPMSYLRKRFLHLLENPYWEGMEHNLYLYLYSNLNLYLYLRIPIERGSSTICGPSQARVWVTMMAVCNVHQNTKVPRKGGVQKMPLSFTTRGKYVCVLNFPVVLCYFMCCVEICCHLLYYTSS